MLQCGEMVDKRQLDEVLSFGRLWYGEPNAVSNATGYAKHSSRSHDAVLLKTPRLRSEESLANPILRICLFRHAQFARRIRNTDGRDLPGRTCEAQGSGV